MVYAPGTLETDPKKQNMALQQQASSIKTNTADIATNTAAIATLNAATYVNSFNSRTGAVTPAQGDYPATLIPGATTNSAITAGNIGEVIEASAALSSVSLTTVTPANITSISLTAGIWDVSGTVYYTPAATTTVTLCQASTNVTSATIDAAPGHFGEFASNATVINNNVFSVSPGQPKRYSLASTTTVYLTTNQTFGTSTLSGGGKIRGVRVA